MTYQMTVAGSFPRSSLYNLQFPGQYYDAETGQTYNHLRDYDPILGRYVESDPLGLKAGMNTYAYVVDNPFSWTDMYGLCPDCKKGCMDAYQQDQQQDYDTYKKAWDKCSKYMSETADRILDAGVGVSCRGSSTELYEAAFRYALYKRDKCLAKCSD